MWSELWRGVFWIIWSGGEGFTVKFGMQYVNLTTKERHFKSSFFEYVNASRMYQQNYTGLKW